jgi:hypothetical protein
MEKKPVLAAFVLGLSVIAAAAVFGLFFYESRKAQHTVQSVGIAVKRYEADIVKWSVSLEESTGINGMKGGYQKIKKSLDVVLGMLQEHGIKRENINLKPVNTFQTYNRDGEITGYKIRQLLYVISDRVEDLEKLALAPETFMEKGVFIQSSNLEYFYSKVDDLKKELLSYATENARQRAEEILKNTGLKIDRLLSVRAGVFQITEPYSTEVSSHGIYNTSSRKKEIKVTVHAVFRIP